MNKLFDIVNGIVILNPTALWVPEFKHIYHRDVDTNKATAYAEISYIVMTLDFNSPYMAYSEKDRQRRVIKDYFPDNLGWKPDKDVRAAIKKFHALQDSVALRALRAAKIALDKATEYFETADSTKALEILRTAKELGPMVKSIDMLTTQVQKEQLESSSIRGGQGIGLFEL